jgi:hypothetical protein
MELCPCWEAAVGSSSAADISVVNGTTCVWLVECTAGEIRQKNLHGVTFLTSAV